MLFILLLSNRVYYKTSYIIRHNLPKFYATKFQSIENSLIKKSNLGRQNQHTIAYSHPSAHLSTNDMGCVHSKSSSSASYQDTQNVPNTLENRPASKTDNAVHDINNLKSTDKLDEIPGTISNRACFGAGCYWGTEKFFKVNFQRQMYPEALIKGKVGFMGPAGSKQNPSYKEVCSGSTGHVEVYDFTYEGGADMYRNIVRFFFQFHDPTTMNQQGNDRGTQYASVIFVYDNIQKQIAHDVIKELQGHLDNNKLSCFKGSQVTTAVMDHTEFYEAHEEHQEYLSKNSNGYCNHRIRFKEWPEDKKSAEP